MDTERIIERYVNKDLSEKEVDALWEELVKDDADLDRLKTEANLHAIYDNDAAETASTNYWMYAAAAVIIIMLGITAVMGVQNMQQTSTLSPIPAFELSYYRSADASADDKEVLLQKAIGLFNNDKVTEAIELLTKARNKATEPAWIAKLDITIGVFYYNTNQFNDAAYYFADVEIYKNQIDRLKLEKAYWYLGNAYFQMNMLSEASSFMQKAYDLNGAYRRVAGRYLNAMATVEP